MFIYRKEVLKSWIRIRIKLKRIRNTAFCSSLVVTWRDFIWNYYWLMTSPWKVNLQYVFEPWKFRMRTSVLYDLVERVQWGSNQTASTIHRKHTQSITYLDLRPVLCSPIDTWIKRVWKLIQDLYRNKDDFWISFINKKF